MPGLLEGALYWVEGRPLMGSSLTSGGSLRRNTPLLSVPYLYHNSLMVGFCLELPTGC